MATAPHTDTPARTAMQLLRDGRPEAEVVRYLMVRTHSEADVPLPPIPREVQIVRALINR